MRLSFAAVMSTIVLMVVLTNCGGLPGADREQAESLSEVIKQDRETLSVREVEFRSLHGSSEFLFFAPFAERERWENDLLYARRALDRADQRYKGVIVPVLRRNRADDSSYLRTTLKSIQAALGIARTQTNRPGERHQALTQEREGFQVRAKADTTGLIVEAEERLTATEITLEKLRGYFNEAGQKPSNGQLDMDHLMERPESLYENARNALRVAQSEFENGGSADQCFLVQKNQESLEEFWLKRDELLRSYSKMLVDMRTDFSIVIGRVSWDKYLDYPKMNRYTHPPRKITEQVYDYFDRITLDPLLSYRGRGLVAHSGVDIDMVKALLLDPMAGLQIDRDLLERWPRGDDFADYWIENMKEAYYHKYGIVENGQRQATDWVPVTEDFYYANIGNLGMDIESKSYGELASEKITDVTPPGMANVGNPHYGRWVSDGRGGRHWSWLETYAFYHLMFGSRYHYYPYNTWNTWNRSYRYRGPYYGGTAAAPLYGTRGRLTQTTSTYRGTNFARSGGFQRASASVRGAGPGSRGSGFGGSGK